MDNKEIEDILDAIDYIGLSNWNNIDDARRAVIVDHITRDFEDELPELIEYKTETITAVEEEIDYYNTHKDNYFNLLTSEIPMLLTTRDFIESTHEYMAISIHLLNMLKAETIDIYTFDKKRIRLIRNLRSRLYYSSHKKRISERRREKRNNPTPKRKTILRKVVEKYKTQVITPRFKNPNHLITYKGVMTYPSAAHLVDIGSKIAAAIHYKHGTSIDLSAMCSLQISGVSDMQIIASSNKVRIIDFDGSPIDSKTIESNLIDAIHKLVDVADGYTFVDDISVRSVFITITAIKYADVTNWFKGIDNTSDKYWDIKGASIYLAFNNNDDDCKKLCVEYFNKVYDPNLTLENMLDNIPIKYYYPKTGNIRDVQSIDDLVSDADKEFIESNDCRNIARIIKANGHMAVISSITYNTRHKTRTQSKRILYQNKPNNIEIFFDIEAYQDKNKDESTSIYYQVPYLLCWADTLSSTVNVIEGSDCCSKFVDIIINTYNNVTIILYAWYGSGYDYHHTLKYMLLKCTSAKYVLRNTSIMSATIYFEDINLIIILKDPYLFLLTSLHKASKAFNVTNKSEFPHEAISSEKDLEVILDHWYTIKEEIIEVYPEYNNSNLLVKRKQIRNYENTKNNDTILEKAIEYCKIDVIAMKEIWVKFQTLLQNSFTLSISEHTFTLSQLSMKLLEANLPKNVTLHVPDLDTYNFMKQAIYGGRVIAKNDHYKEELLYADVVSLYPSAMKLLEHGYGDSQNVSEIDWSRHGIYEVTLTHPEDTVPVDYAPFVPRRLETGRLSWTWFKESTGIYHTYDLLIAKDLGYNIKCQRGIEFAKKGYILHDFVTKLFDLKDSHSNCECNEQPCPIRMIAKIALNGGGYGKFVQKPILKSAYIVERDIIASQYDSIPRNSENKITVGGKQINPPTFYNLDGDDFDKMIIEVDDKPYYSTQTGISILSASRYRLYSLCRQFKNMDVVYSDTDSIFVKASSVDKASFNSFCGIELGQLDNKIDGSLNNTISEMIVLGPKMYAYKYLTSDNKEKITFHCKGVPTRMLSWNQFVHLSKTKTNRNYYEFDTIAKKITTVMTRNINKQIHQT